MSTRAFRTLNDLPFNIFHALQDRLLLYMFLRVDIMRLHPSLCLRSSVRSQRIDPSIQQEQDATSNHASSWAITSTKHPMLQDGIRQANTG